MVRLCSCSGRVHIGIILLYQEIGYAVERSSECFVEHGIVSFEAIGLEFLCVVGVMHESQSAYVVVDVGDALVRDVGAVLEADLAEEPQARLPVDLVGGGPERYHLLVEVLRKLGNRVR